jgi:hypothetical protein
MDMYNYQEMDQLSRLREWNANKILLVINKLCKLLQRKIGEKYTLIPTPDMYRNVWGRFLGYWIISNKKKVFRFNIRLEKADQANIVSVDRFITGIGESKPIATLSLEGFGIGKIFFSLVDFMLPLNPRKTLQQESAEISEMLEGYGLYTSRGHIEEAKWTPQPAKTPAGKSNLVGLTANFLGENPSWIASLASGSFEALKLAKEIKEYLIKNDFNVTGYGAPKFFAALKKAIIFFDDLGGQKAADNLPVAKVYKGVPDKPLAVQPPAVVSKALTAMQQAVLDAVPASETIADFKETVKDMINQPQYTKGGACAYGRGGTGKSETVKQIVREEGLTEGLGYVWITGKVDGSGGLLSTLFNNRFVPLVVFDDCDNIFNTDSMKNIMKGVLQDMKVYITSKNSNIRDIETDEPVEPSKTGYALESHYLFIKIQTV